MTERLHDRHKERVQEGARRYVEHKKAMREFVGPGGVTLTDEEQHELYLKAKADPEMMLSILQKRQEEHKLEPTQVPRDFVEWVEKMEATESQEGSQEEFPQPSEPRQS